MAHQNGGEPVDRRSAICVVGAGSSGLATGKNLREYGFDVDIIEREDEAGGNWNFGKENSRVYQSTHTISSKPFTQYPDFPMPDAFPDYPHHSEILEYLIHYKKHFGLSELIEYETEVVAVEYKESTRHYVEIQHMSYLEEMAELIERLDAARPQLTRLEYCGHRAARDRRTRRRRARRDACSRALRRARLQRSPSDVRRDGPLDDARRWLGGTAQGDGDVARADRVGILRCLRVLSTHQTYFLSETPA